MSSNNWYSDAVRNFNLDIPEDAMVTFSYSGDAEVYHHNGGDVSEALEETDVLTEATDFLRDWLTLARFSGGTLVTDWARNEYPERFGDAIFSLDSLENVEDMDYADRVEIEDAAVEVGHDLVDTIQELVVRNFHDQDFITAETRMYDHKRGLCTLTATVEIPHSALEAEDLFHCPHGWDVSVVTAADPLRPFLLLGDT